MTDVKVSGDIGQQCDRQELAGDQRERPNRK
jgi:hypothetical protein